MPSLLNTHDNEVIVNRISKLTPDSPAQWGKMNVSQMLAHCQAPMRVVFGEATVKRGLIGMLFGGIAKKKMVNFDPFSKGLPTDPTFIVNRPVNFNEEKGKLIVMVERFHDHPEQIQDSKHPFFGKMTREEWDTLGWKHLDHHLRQFGV
jgi:hypothetical protein